MGHGTGHVRRQLNADEKVGYLRMYCRELIPATPNQIRGQLTEAETLVLIIQDEKGNEKIKEPRLIGHLDTQRLERIMKKENVTGFFAVTTDSRRYTDLF